MDTDDYHDEEYHENEMNTSCVKCNRFYDEIDYEFQRCKKCGWDAEYKVWARPLKPTDDDYLSGEADILTGEWN